MKPPSQSGPDRIRCLRVLRRHRRSGLQEDLSRALCHGVSGAAFTSPSSAWRGPDGILDKLKERARDSVKHSGDFDDADFREARRTAALRRRRLCGPRDLRQAEDRHLGPAKSPIHYLAIPPSMFASVVQGLQKSGCAENARVIVEKPFGRDLASAQALNRTLHEVFDESSIFRIDHYLGKEAVQNILYFRFRQYISRTDMESRIYSRHSNHDGGEFRRARPRRLLRGSRRDPRRGAKSLAAGRDLAGHGCACGPRSETMQAEKLRIFRAMRPLDPKEVVRGQFRGYRAEKGVAKDSQVETFAALHLHIDTWRWADVPFYIRAGKNLPITATEVRVTLKRPPLAIFDPSDNMPSNYFRLRLSPEVVIGEGALVEAQRRRHARRAGRIDCAPQHAGREISL